MWQRLLTRLRVSEGVGPDGHTTKDLPHSPFSFLSKHDCCHDEIGRDVGEPAAIVRHNQLEATQMSDKPRMIPMNFVRNHGALHVRNGPDSACRALLSSLLFLRSFPRRDVLDGPVAPKLAGVANNGAVLFDAIAGPLGSRYVTGVDGGYTFG